LTHSEVEQVDGYVGNFTVRVRRKARKVDESLCTGCGECWSKCPIKVIDTDFEAGLGYRKAIYRPFPQAVPKYPVIDVENCTYYKTGKCRMCEKVCPTGAIRFDMEDEVLDRKLATSSWRPLPGVRCAPDSPSTVMAVWRMFSPAWNSSVYPTRPGQPKAISSSATRDRTEVGSRGPLRRQSGQAIQLPLLGDRAWRR
jgi:ferredoxin